MSTTLRTCVIDRQLTLKSKNITVRLVCYLYVFLIVLLLIIIKSYKIKLLSVKCKIHSMCTDAIILHVRFFMF